MPRLFVITGAAALLLVSLSFVGCASAQRSDANQSAEASTTRSSTSATPGDVAQPEPAGRTLDEGYSLLITLCRKNRDVDKLLWLKSVSSRTKPLIQEAAGTCRQIAADLPKLFDQPPVVDADETGLPEIESRTRKGIEKERTGTLLGLSGDAFERELLISQIQAMRYAQELCSQLADEDTNAERKAYLEQMAAKISNLNKQLEQRLTPAGS